MVLSMGYIPAFRELDSWVALCPHTPAAQVKNALTVMQQMWLLFDACHQCQPPRLT